MKKAKIIFSIFFIGLATLLSAHTALLYVEDNYDGTISVECAFSNGADTAGLTVYIVENKAHKGKEESFEGKKVLYKTTLDKLGCADIVKPATKDYLVIFNGGVGHTTSLKGKVLTDDEKDEWNAYIKKNKKLIGKWLPLIQGKK